MYEFNRIKRLPPYVFAIVNHLKMESRRQGEDIIDLGKGRTGLLCNKPEPFFCLGLVLPIADLLPALVLVDIL